MLDIDRFTADMPSLNQIKSIQMVYIPSEYGGDGTARATINAVDPANSIVLLATTSMSITSSSTGSIVNVSLSSATEVLVDYYSNFYGLTVLVIEFNAFAVKSVQSGSVTVSNDSSAVVTISTVTPAKCIAACYFMQGDSGGVDDTERVLISAISATSITLTQPLGDAPCTASWRIIELR